MSEDVHKKIMYWVNKSNLEVSGLGTLRVEDDGVLRVVSAMLLPQKNGATNTDIEADVVGKAMYELRDADGEMKFWWHSHVNMAVFWSGTDMDTIKKIGNGGWFLSTVFNKKNEMRSAFYQVDGMQTPWGSSPLFIDELETKIETNTTDEKEWEAEYQTNVVEFIRPAHVTGWADDEEYSGHWAKDETTGFYRPKSEVEKNERPQGMTKKEWKRKRREQRGAVLDMSKQITVEEDRTLDVYGFTQEERTYLAIQGVDQAEIDDMIQCGYTASDILAEIEDDAFSDVPVADRRYLS